jgi:hypothetical protein
MSKLRIIDLAWQDLTGFDKQHLEETLNSPFTMVVHHAEPALQVAEAIEASGSRLVMIRDDSGLPCGFIAPHHFRQRVAQSYALADNLSLPEIVAYLERFPGNVHRRVLERPYLEWCSKHSHYVVPPCTLP